MPRSRTRSSRRAFTLIESMMAVGLLLVAVVAVTSAVTAGQQHAYEAHLHIAGSLAAEELMGRLMAEEYDDLSSWNGYIDAPGAMTAPSGGALPASFALIGRTVQVHPPVDVTQVDVGVTVRGRLVQVRAVDAGDRQVVELSRFVPEPPA